LNETFLVSKSKKSSVGEEVSDKRIQAPFIRIITNHCGIWLLV